MTNITTTKWVKRPCAHARSTVNLKLYDVRSGKWLKKSHTHASDGVCNSCYVLPNPPAHQLSTTFNQLCHKQWDAIGWQGLFTHSVVLPPPLTLNIFINWKQYKILSYNSTKWQTHESSMLIYELNCICCCWITGLHNLNITSTHKIFRPGSLWTGRQALWVLSRTPFINVK